MTRINVRVMIISTRGGINMLEVIRNVVESKTMVMLVCTGVGVMILLVISIMNMF